MGREGEGEEREREGGRGGGEGERCWGGEEIQWFTLQILGRMFPAMRADSREHMTL